jgi:hypothetical protein
MTQTMALAATDQPPMPRIAVAIVECPPTCRDLGEPPKYPGNPVWRLCVVVCAQEL